jgi:hypothetical protein
LIHKPYLAFDPWLFRVCPWAGVKGLFAWPADRRPKYPDSAMKPPGMIVRGAPFEVSLVRHLAMRTD